MSSKDNIEKIFKDKLGTYEVKPPVSVWKTIQRKMFFKRFLIYKPFSLNLWNLSVIIIIAVFVLIINPAKVTNKDELSKIVPKKESTTKITELKTSKNDNVEEKIEERNSILIKKINPKQEKKESEKQITDFNKEDDKSEKFVKKDDTNSESNSGENQTVKLAETIRCDFRVSAEKACEPAVISFLNTSENGETYLWDFGNGETSELKNPTYVFRTAGTYIVKLTVYSGSFSDSKTKKIIVYPKPNADFQISNKSQNLFSNEEIQFLNNSTGFSKCIWKFGDDNTSSFTNPVHIYNEQGLYKVSLICISKNRCADTAFLNNVLVQDSKYKIVFPTAFTPDKSGQSNGEWRNSIYPNTIFHPVINAEVSDYSLKIYNKYGAKVFETDNVDVGWNGFYNNAPAPRDVYIWECNGKFEDGKLFKETGNVTLLYLRNQ